jgi:hypothetical protein
MQQLQATLSQTYRGEPLAVIDGGPFAGGAELTPAQCRALAAALQRIAEDADARKLTHRGKPTPVLRKVYRTE